MPVIRIVSMTGKYGRRSRKAAYKMFSSPLGLHTLPWLLGVAVFSVQSFCSEAALAAFAKSWDVSRPALPLARPLALEWAQRPGRMCEIVSVPITVPVADETATTRLGEPDHIRERLVGVAGFEPATLVPNEVCLQVDQRLTNDIRELKANIRERSNRVRTRKALKMVGPGGFEPPTRPL